MNRSANYMLDMLEEEDDKASAGAGAGAGGAAGRKSGPTSAPEVKELMEDTKVERKHTSCLVENKKLAAPVLLYLASRHSFGWTMQSE